MYNNTHYYSQEITLTQECLPEDSGKFKRGGDDLSIGLSSSNHVRGTKWQARRAGVWPELKLPDLLFTDTVRKLHEAIESEWDSLLRSACQTAAGRALWKHVTHDQLAELLVGETDLRSLYEKRKKDRCNNSREVSGVMLAVRTCGLTRKLKPLSDPSMAEEEQRWFFLVQAATASTNDHQQHVTMTAKSLNRVAADITDNDWLQKLQISGFVPEKKYSLVLLADFMNKSSTTLSSSMSHFHSDWPNHLLPSLGFSEVKLSQIGDPDAHFGLLHDPLNLFNKLRSLPRSVQTHPDDGTPCCRLYLQHGIDLLLTATYMRKTLQ
ncbi:leucine carboxyl methyltransferase [Actinidia rufa]|uniref:Leucine carboxyl methyltransferase n=1 Tax=Actinidia rufa TaxID=165716 RepID=A0A7J0EI60_9ERIC|nr:leucine carboxyl methyltransferase [Actinidia rufa]